MRNHVVREWFRFCFKVSKWSSLKDMDFEKNMLKNFLQNAILKFEKNIHIYNFECLEKTFLDRMKLKRISE